MIILWYALSIIFFLIASVGCEIMAIVLNAWLPLMVVPVFVALFFGSWKLYLDARWPLH